jgi:hypothetical protein
MLIPFGMYIYIIFQIERVTKSHKTARNKVFSNFLCLLMQETVVDPGSVQINFGSGFGSRRLKNIRILRIRIRMRMRVLNTGLHWVNYRMPVNWGMAPITAVVADTR